MALLKNHLLIWIGVNLACGFTPSSQHCVPQVQCPLDGNCEHGNGPSAGDPVNLATGEEEYSPEPDLVVYNPIGPSVVWQRLYESLRGDFDPATQINDFGANWSHSYNIGVYQYNNLEGFNLDIVFPDGAHINSTCHTPPVKLQQSVPCQVNTPGSPYLVEWDYDPNGNGGQGSLYATITLQNRTKWITTDYYEVSTPQGTINWYPIGKIVDRNGNAINFNYTTSYTTQSNPFPVLTSITDSNGAALLTLDRATDGTGNLTDVYDRDTRIVYYHVGTYANQNVPSGYPQSQQELDQVSEIGFNPPPPGTLHYGLPPGIQPPNRWTYGYTNYSNLTLNTFVNPYVYEQVPYLSSITVPSPTGTGTSTATITYDNSTAAVSSITDANGNTRSYTSVDGSHTKVTITNASGTVYSYTAQFDSNMNYTGQTDGTNINYVWQASGYGSNGSLDPYRPSTIINGNYVSGSNNNQWTFAWDQYGNLESETTPYNSTTTYSWYYFNFALGELTEVQEGSKSPTSFHYYEPSGLVQYIISPLPGTSGSSSTATTTYTYDPLGNIKTINTPGNNATIVNGVDLGVTTTFNYATDGSYSQPEALGQPLTITDNLNKISHFRYDGRANCIASIDALGNETDVNYDLADQPTSITYPATGQTGLSRAYKQFLYQYQGGPLTSSNQFDESNNQVRQISYTYGLEGELLSKSGSTEPASYTYDGDYRIQTLKDGNNNVTSYQFNPAGYLSQISYPLNSGTYDTISYPSYDNIGNPLKRIDGNNVETDYVYNDPESRLTNINYPASSAINVTLGYDPYGRMDTMTDGTGSTAWNFDDDDELTGTQVTYTGLTAKTVSYTFYPDGSRETMSTPAGSFTYNYDADGRPNQLTNPYSQSFLWAYLDNGWLYQQQSKNGSGNVMATSTATRNAWGQATQWLTQKGSGSTISNFGGTGSSSMVYDAVGNLKSMPATLTGLSAYSGTNNYSYDNLNELLSEQSTRNSGYTNSFGYDAALNPTTFRGATLTFNADNQNNAYTFDGNGNPTTYKGVSLTFDPENHLTAYGSLMTAGYRGDGLRAWKQTSAGTTYFLYDGMTPVCELNSSGTVTAVNTFGATGLLERHTSSHAFYTFDPVGNVCQRLNGSGSALGSYLFDAFGNRTSTDSSTDPYSGFGSQAGYYTDWETGLELLGHRYYDPGGGRFINRDPISYSGGINLYSYVINKAPNSMDPSGLQANTASGPYWPGALLSAFASIYNYFRGSHPCPHSTPSVSNPLPTILGNLREKKMIRKLYRKKWQGRNPTDEDYEGIREEIEGGKLPGPRGRLNKTIDEIKEIISRYPPPDLPPGYVDENHPYTGPFHSDATDANSEVETENPFDEFEFPEIP